MSKEAMKLALEAFSVIAISDNLDWIRHQAEQQATALRESLAEQPAQQEPDETKCPECGYLTKHTEHIGCLRKQLNAINAFEQRNFAIVNMDKFPPAQRTWVGLTDDEAQKTFMEHNCTISADLAGILVRAIEAKLKELNND